MITVAEVAQTIDATVTGDADIELHGLGSLGTAAPGQLSHLSSSNYRHLLASTRASAVIVSPEDAADCPVTALVVDNPYLAFAKASMCFVQRVQIAPGIHPSAVIAESAQIDASACIGPNVVIGADTVVSAGTQIHAGASVGERCKLGPRVTLYANSTLYSDVQLGENTQIHSAAVIGAAGFGFAPDAKGHLHEIAQIGGVVIGANVSVGAGTTIDCGAIDATVVEDGVKIDNQVQVGHNSHIGAHTVICGCVGIAGSSVIGKHCVLAGGAGVGGDKPVTLCDGVRVTACTTISQSVNEPGTYSGSIVFHDHGKWRRNALRFFALDDLFKRVKRLERADTAKQNN
ncbi:MAG: UDP-3-O-(3-hydroxymyristoyl)glucosamine N-acyltransferase [Pseudomonadaceae bacterium]|nr:UDP-3-O-(3-hydroxymyristoyl)glucosamine N-acyltransferase [Pseudomonadaceae bacterium]